MKTVDNVKQMCYIIINKKKEGRMEMIKFSFRKDPNGTIYATAGDWTNEFSPSGEVFTSLKHHSGEAISPEEAEDILWTYGWAICPKCGNIYPALGECLW